MLAPIKWRTNCDNPQYHRKCSQVDEQLPLIQQNKSEEKHTVTEIFYATDLDLLTDYKYLTISIGLSFIIALSNDLSRILPKIFEVRNYL